MYIKAKKKKIISTSVSLLYVHHCVTTGDPSASKYSACHWNTPTAEREVHTSIYLMSTCDGWPHLLEIPTWEAPPTHSMWRCQHILPWSGRSVVYPAGCFMEIILYIKLITSGIIIASLTLTSRIFTGGLRLKEGQIDFPWCRCHITKWGLRLLLDSKCFPKDCLYPPPLQLI